MKRLHSKFKLNEKVTLRLGIFAGTMVLLVLNYFLMYFDYLTFFSSGETVFFKTIENTGEEPDIEKIGVIHFYFSKFIRLVFNDLLSVVLIFMIFFDRKIFRVSIIVLFLNALILFPVVSILLINFPRVSQAFARPLHFIIMNPVLVFLLVPFFLLENNEELGN